MLKVSDILPNEHIRIEAMIGEGAFDVVYRAWDETLARAVAVKELRRDAPGMSSTTFGKYADRFRREARVQAQFNHPHLVHVYRLLEQGDTLYLVMEFVEGANLRDVLAQRGPLPVEEAVQITLDLLEALVVVHQHPWDIVHRDIKPSNVLLSAGGAKLTDFGLAQLASESSRTAPGANHPGTPLYMSPEQERTAAYLRPASDLYSVGCVLFELLTGKAYKQVDDEPEALLRLRPDVPPALAHILQHATAKDLTQRYRRAGEFAADLRSCMLEKNVLCGPNMISAPKRQRSAAANLPLQLSLAPGIEMSFVFIPAGEFIMGSDLQMDALALQNEIPQRQVHLDAYEIAKYPVTNAQYAVFVQATQHHPPRHWQDGWIPNGKGQYPATDVSWKDAVAFCAWLARVSNRKVRLPTEAEWEKAARGSDGRLYPWGNEAPDATRCNFAQNEHGTTPVGKYNPQGDNHLWLRRHGR